MKTTALIKKNIEAGQDFEWYPTTGEMLACIDKNILYHFGDYENKHTRSSVLDLGAGDGRALKALSHGGDMYAVEKSFVLLENMPDDIFIAGTEFKTTTLIDKKVDIIFSNPPYSEYEAWAYKIIMEASSKMVYLVLPKRWKNSVNISGAIKKRDAAAKVIGSFNFMNADRKARAEVEIIAVKMYEKYGSAKEVSDPFDIWFDQQFIFDTDEKETSEYGKKESEKNSLHEKLNGSLVNGRGLIQVLVDLYNNELSHLQQNYSAVAQLDSEILRELDVNVSGLKAALKQKIKGLKSKYWHEFFSNYKSITSRLTSKSRQAMLSRLDEHLSVDFTEENCLAISIWAIKNANLYYDSQLVQLVEGMVSDANIFLYKSNQRVFERDEWRYGRKPEGLAKFALELRIILQNKGGVYDGKSFGSYYYDNNLHKDAHEFINDVLTVANNLGFICLDNSRWHEWQSNKKVLFAGGTGKVMEVKAFKNGNLHVKFNQKLIKALNIEFGRLKGWLKDPAHVSNELGISPKEAGKFFNINEQLTLEGGLPMITMKEAA